MFLSEGSTLQNGKYRIEKTLGQGSFGITYLATATFTTESGLGKMDVVAKVCIKEFYMSDVNSRGNDGSTVEGSGGNVFTNYRRKFRKEAENLAKLSHSNIVRVFDVFDENGTSYYVMEYLDGENLDEYIKSRGRLGEDEAIKIIREIGGALSYMHSKKMLHLDLKPKNVMHQKDRGNTLIDFGLSKQYTNDGEPETSTSIGLGTPGYAPLEQAHYSQDGTFPATLDVYALGATMFKMLTGHRPPEATEILNYGFPSKELRDLHISDRTIATLAKSMNPIKKDRWADVKSFIGNFAESDDDHTLINNHRELQGKNEGSSQNDMNISYSDSLVAVWKSRNIITNLACVIGILATLLMYNLLSAYVPTEHEQAIFTLLGLLSIVAGIVAIMYGKKTLLYAPLIIIPICNILVYLCSVYSSLTTTLCETLFLISCYLLVVGSLFLKKNGIRAFTQLTSMSFGKNGKWNNVVSAFSYIATIILIISIPCLLTNIDHAYFISYYLFGACELIAVLFCAILICMRLRMGVYLLPVIILLGYFQDYVTYTGAFSAFFVENCVSSFFLIELALLLFVKKDGLTAWSVMK